MKFWTLSVLVFAVLLQAAPLRAGDLRRSLAIVADPATLDHCLTSIEAYSKSISEEGLNPIVITDKWGIPDSIRKVLYGLYRKNNLEGAVFVGDIPVPMIRDAHHLSTAFKMDPRRAWDQSSIPSDRFYDDFDLKFNYLKHDSVYPLFHYYSLAYDGPQEISCDIYSARVKAPSTPGKTKYELINDYFFKVVREKENRRKMGQVTFFAGHGYNSTCMVARMDEKLALTEQFPFLHNPPQALNYIDYTYDDNVKYRLLAELARKDLDLAILHHHGSEDLQLLNGSPISSNTQVWIDQARKFFRGKIRNAKDTTATKKYYLDNYPIPEAWVNDAFNPALMEADSLQDVAIDMQIADLYGYESGARMIILDACFTGSFHLDDYISGHYIFNPGSTVVVKANTVNTLQDIWTDQLMGLLDLGVSVGNWARGQFTLESHLLGDPTWRFLPGTEGKYDLNQALTQSKTDVKFWIKLMKHPHPEVKSLAMKMLSENGAISPKELLSIMKEEKRATVRLQAFNLIKKAAGEELVPAIKLGLNDNFELLRRLSALTASENGSPQLIGDVIKLRIEPGMSRRVDFHLNDACGIFNKEQTIAAFENALKDKTGKWYENETMQLVSLKSAMERREKEFSDLLDPKVPLKAKRFTVTALRNSCDASYLDTLFSYYRGLEEQEPKLTLIEALGWYTYSWKKAEILDFLRNQLAVEKDDRVKQELTRSIARIK
jgi:hypothetical protein